MKPRYDIAFDLDDVIFDTSIAFIEQMKENNEIPKEFSVDDIAFPDVHKMFGIKSKQARPMPEGFFENLRAHPQIVSDVKQLRDFGVHVCFITSRTFSTIGETYSALRRIELEEYPYEKNVFFCPSEDKATVARQLGVWLMVDDRPNIAWAMSREGIMCLVPQMSYNSYLDKFENDLVYRGNWLDLREILFEECRRQFPMNFNLVSNLGT